MFKNEDKSSIIQQKYYHSSYLWRKTILQRIGFTNIIQ